VKFMRVSGVVALVTGLPGEAVDSANVDEGTDVIDAGESV